MALTRPEDIQHNQSIAIIVDQIRVGKVIPIVGYDLLMHGQRGVAEDEGQSRPIDFLKLLIKKHAPDQDYESIFIKKHGFIPTGFELLNSFYHGLPNKNTFKINLSDTIRAERFNLDLVTPGYRKLVSIKQFNLFINATFTNSLELAVNNVRVAGASQDEIKSSYIVRNFHPFMQQDLPQRAPDRFNLKFDQPIIYNLFGTHDEQQGDYVLTDADYVELIYDLIHKGDEKFPNLLSYLTQADLLFLGCNFPDWFFRFFVRICAGDRLDQNSTSFKAVIDSLNSPESDRSRSFFITNYGIKTLNLDCNRLIDEIYRRLQGLGLIPDQENNKVFISYCRADEPFVLQFCKLLDDCYIDYFLDKNNLRTGDKLSETIKQAIDKSCLFIPIVSHNIKQSTPYVWWEWEYAVNTKKKIWPLFRHFPGDTPFNAGVGIVVSPELKSLILDKNNTLGIIAEGDNNGDGPIRVAEKVLKAIKNEQYLASVSGNKKM